MEGRRLDIPRQARPRGVQGRPLAKIDYRLQLEFASPKIVDAYLRFKPFDQLNVQIGQFKVPFTIENTHYAPLKFEFIEYSLGTPRRLMGLDDVSGIKSTGPRRRGRSSTATSSAARVSAC